MFIHFRQQALKFLIYINNAFGIYVKLGSKAVLFGAALALAGYNGVSWFGALLFIAVASVIYVRPFLEGYETKSAFAVLLATSLLAVNVAHGSALFLPLVFFFSLIFYWIVGIKDLLFIKRSRLYYVAALSLFYTMFALFFLSDISEMFLWKYGAVILGTYLLFREWLRLISTFHFPQRERLAALLGAFLIAQLLWATALLPIGFINSADMMLLFTFVIAELLVNHFTGNISKNFLVQLLGISAALFLLIYWTSRWTLK